MVNMENNKHKHLLLLPIGMALLVIGLVVLQRIPILGIVLLIASCVFNLVIIYKHYKSDRDVTTSEA